MAWQTSSYGAIRSRRLLIDAVNALSLFQDAITVVGAHAVHEWVKEAWGSVDIEATRDADITINPSFVADNPSIIETLKNIGLEPALRDRPGVYGLEIESSLPLEARTTFDILVPECYAGGGNRAARISGQKNTAGRAVGLELSLWDRHFRKLATIDEPINDAEVFIAGPAALLVAKTHKIHERLEQVVKRPDRLRPKDSGDIALLMMVSDPVEIRQIMNNNATAHPEAAEVIWSAASWLVEMYSDTTQVSVTRQQAADSLAARFDENDVFAAIDSWLKKFVESP